MTSPSTGGDHDRAESASMGDDWTPMCDALQQALNAEDTDSQHYHLREALQLLHIQNNEEVVRLTKKALDTEDPDAAEFVIREALELLRIQATATTVRRTDTDKRAK